MSDWSRWYTKDTRKSFSGFQLKEGQMIPGDPKTIAAQQGWTPDNFGFYRDSTGKVVARTVSGKLIMVNQEEQPGGTQPTGTLDTGNPSGASGLSPADRARSLGLQSNGKGGYMDDSGNVVARTVNNELVFYDNGASGGVVSDGGGGMALSQSQPSWVDPDTGLIMVPPAQPETPSELAAIPDPTPATPPMGFDTFVKQRHLEKKQQKGNPQPEMPQGPMSTESFITFRNKKVKGENKKLEDFAQIFEGPEHAPGELVKRLGKRRFGSNPQIPGQPNLDSVLSDIRGSKPQTPTKPPAETPVRQSLSQFQQGRRPKSGKSNQAAFDAVMDPKNAPGVDPKEYDAQAAQVAKKDAVDKAIDRTSPEAQGVNENLERQRQAKALSFAQKLENVKPDTSPVGRQELASAIAMMHALRNSRTNTSGGNEELFQMLQAVYPDMAEDSNKSNWYDTFIGQGNALRKNLNLGDDDIDDDWAVERTANRNRMDFIDPEDQQDIMQYTWDKLGDTVRKNYGSQLDSFNPADLTFARKSQLKAMKGGIDKIVEEFGDKPDILPGLINAYMDRLEEAGHLHRASLKQGDTEKGVEVQGKPVNKGAMKGFDIDYDEDGNPRLFSGGFLDGQNPRTSLGITADKMGRLGFDSHSLLMSPYFETGGKKDRYSIENKVGSLMGDAVESRELPEARPDKVPYRSIKGGPSPANARGGGIPVQELADLIKQSTGEDINYRLGVKQKTKKDGSLAAGFEPDQFSDEDKQYWGGLLQSLIDEQDDNGNPFFNFGDGPSFNGEALSAQDWINRTLDMANNGMDGDNKHETKFTNGLRAKLRQFRLMQMLQQARQKSPNDLAKLLAKLKYMAKKQGITGDLDKGGYTLYQ